METYNQGYDNTRFENVVDENYHCPICMKVLKEPVQCRRNEHYFCTPCITRHLQQNSQTCPACKEELTLQTLNQPARIVTSCLSNLKIRCDYFSRGCGEIVQLGDLKTHVANCGFSPVLCSNEGCSLVINKRDEENHKTQVCDYRKVKCHDCVEMRKEMDEMKLCLNGIKEQLETAGKRKDQMHCMQEKMMKEVKGMMGEMKDEMRNMQHAFTDLNQFKTIIIQQEQQHHPENIIIAGGENLNSVEMFSWSTRTWEQLKPMKNRRGGASSFVYENQMFVTGGKTSGLVKTDSIEIMNINQGPKEWFNYPARLPSMCDEHKCLVYKDRLFLIGGYVIGNECQTSSGIYEILLVAPYSSKLISRLPQPTYSHAAELFNDKIFIVGGTTTGNYKYRFDSVVMYDINNNECKQMAPLPFAVSGMATVGWGDSVIVIGGVDKYGKELNTVVMYNVKTGESKMLPSMKYERCGCSAVIKGNVIVVMGGYNKEQGILNTVEFFSFDDYLWKELRPMNEPRFYATAVVKSGDFA